MKQRICSPFPVVVKGTDIDGTAFEVSTVTDNLSEGYLYVRLMPCVVCGAKLSVTLQLSASVMSAATTRVEINGVVIRLDFKPGGVCGVAVAFEQHRFIYSPCEF